ncbi:DNase I-like protein [Wolfiporia cocos MD-104 SS10]|uniref:DNase I-like protein n=1 Tax=Wolfiporia cocos (strain MD-104) TaxID=742152 RepID=A0A2H3JMC8_WOLCO|nr:DNase I-like protein [Wolfiporia cocos MD-104 SS10]
MRTTTKRPRNDDHTDTDAQPSTSKKARTDTVSPPAEDSPSNPANTSGVTRILSWNVETPVPFLDIPPRKVGTSAVTPGSSLSLLHDLIARHDFPDFVCLQEVRARQTDKEWIAALKSAPNKADCPKYTAYMSLNRAIRGQRHFGVVTYTKYPEQINAAREVDWDAEGRIMILEMKTGWALVNVYALNGSEYMWRDALGQSAPKTRNERKREFNRLLLDECRAMQARGLRLVLIGDFNISLTKRDCVPRLRTEYPHGLARKEFKEEFMPGLDVVDVYRAVHGNRQAFSWFAKGRPQGADAARVDYALVERALVDRVVEMTYLEDNAERAHSDHAPVILSLRDMHDLPPPNPSPSLPPPPEFMIPMLQILHASSSGVPIDRF